MAGIETSRPLKVHVKSLGGGGKSDWKWRSSELFASGWIINAKTRSLVWEMTTGNTRKSSDGRSCDEWISLEPGAYEVYFAAPVFSHNSWATHVVVNVDHRKKPLFGNHDGDGWFKGWFTEDFPEAWEKLAKEWGIDILVNDGDVSSVKQFSAPRKLPNIAFQAIGLGEGEIIRQGIAIREPVSMDVYAIGEKPGNGDLADFGWMVNANTRERVWEMTPRNTRKAGGAEKNTMLRASIRLDKGDYVLYFVTDDSHSSIDWNSPPPYDPTNWGVTLSLDRAAETEMVKTFQYREGMNVIAEITRPGDDENRQESFSLKEPVQARVYAFGERSNSKRTMADFGYILDARTREKVWTMDIDRCHHAGGGSKNLYVDEVIPLRKGSYVLIYKTDDSHSYNDWNDDPPFDEEHYGITLLGVGKGFKSNVVVKVDDDREKGVIALVVRVGNDASASDKFRLDKPTRVRVYAIGEGQQRTMYDYGWIENVKSGAIVWEMTYGMSFHAGGGRKNRMVNTTILLEKGEYVLRHVSDDSHSYGDWNDDPPDDPQYWGITLFEEGADNGLPPPPPPKP